MTVVDEVIARVVGVAEPDRIVLSGSAAHVLVGVGVPDDVVVVTPGDVAAYTDDVATLVGAVLRDGREVHAA